MESSRISFIRQEKAFYAFLDGEPFVAFGVSFHPPVKPEGMFNLETLLGLG